MGRYGVLEQGEGIAQALAGRFGPPCPAAEEPELLIISPAAAGAGLEWPLRCVTVLLPGDAGELLKRIEARSAVSYGLSPRDTITLSSQEGEQFCLAVQRELVTVDGTVLDRQELVLRKRPTKDPMLCLVLTGAMLLLGAEPEE